MKFENYMILEFPSKSTNEGFARSAVACFAAQLDPTMEELGDIRTAVSEAVTNCIVHAYNGDVLEKDKRISLKAEYFDDVESNTSAFCFSFNISKTASLMSAMFPASLSPLLPSGLLLSRLLSVLFVLSN